MLRLMIDLETLSNLPTAAIMEIGLVAIVDQSIDMTFSAKIDIDDAIRHGSVNGSTIQFWAGQPHFQEMLNGTLNLDDALTGLGKWIEAWRSSHGDGDEKIEQIWAMPANFDLPILRHAIHQMGVPNFLEDFRSWRCLSTLRREAERLQNVVVDRVMSKHPHQALSDAIAQSEYLFKLENAMRSITWGAA